MGRRLAKKLRQYRVVEVVLSTDGSPVDRGFFHKWDACPNGSTCALVEVEDGTMILVSYRLVRFLDGPGHDWLWQF